MVIVSVVGSDIRAIFGPALSVKVSVVESAITSAPMAAALFCPLRVTVLNDDSLAQLLLVALTVVTVCTQYPELALTSVLVEFHIFVPVKALSEDQFHISVPVNAFE